MVGMAMRVAVLTARFGAVETVEVPETALFTFPDGLPGFEGYTAFALIEDDAYHPFGWLQAQSDPNVKFIVVDPQVASAGYAVDLPDGDVAALALGSPDEARLLAIVTVPETVEAMTANLKAPVVLNRARRIGRQVILNEERYALRHPLLQPGADGAG